MAIFYNHIKGCGQYATGEGAVYKEIENSSGWKNTTEYWAWIDWENYIFKKDGSNTIAAHIQSSPKIKINDSNDKASAVELGYILTSGALYQYIVNDFEFQNKVTINNLYMNTMSAHSRFLNQHWYFGSQKAYSSDFMTSSILNFSLESGADYNQFEYPYMRMYLEKNDNKTPFYGFYMNLFGGKQKLSPTLVFTAPSFNFREGNTTINCNLHVGSGSSDLTKGIITADNKCEAKYFNATSDRRAKSNIKPAKFSALDIIKQLPIYTFNYLNDPKLSVGLIAQEAAEHDLDGFNMVDNLDASGEFGDFMQMKESKLVYVLWKAVQELSAEVEDLKAQIRNLK